MPTSAALLVALLGDGVAAQAVAAFRAVTDGARGFADGRVVTELGVDHAVGGLDVANELAVQPRAKV